MSTTSQTVEGHQSMPLPAAEAVVNTNTPLGWIDITVTAAIVAAALYYLYRKLWRKRGQCGGCSSQGKAGCAVKTAAPPRTQ